jgi:hypothetical protein
MAGHWCSGAGDASVLFGVKTNSWPTAMRRVRKTVKVYACWRVDAHPPGPGRSPARRRAHQQRTDRGEVVEAQKIDRGGESLPCAQSATAFTAGLTGARLNQAAAAQREPPRRRTSISETAAQVTIGDSDLSRAANRIGEGTPSFLATLRPAVNQRAPTTADSQLLAIGNSNGDEARQQKEARTEYRRIARAMVDGEAIRRDSLRAIR